MITTKFLKLDIGSTNDFVLGYLKRDIPCFQFTGFSLEDKARISQMKLLLNSISLLADWGDNVTLGLSDHYKALHKLEPLIPLKTNDMIRLPINPNDYSNYITYHKKENRIEVVEVVKNSENIGAIWNDKYEAWETTVDGKPIGDFADTKDEAIRYGKANFGDATKFGNYQLAGEKENYKEVYIVLPRTGKSGEFADWAVPLAHRTGDELVDNRQIVRLRMSTRMGIDENGKQVKTLFIDEFQGDRGQAGRKEGFKGKKANEIKTVTVSETPETIIDEGTSRQKNNYVVFADGVRIGLVIRDVLREISKFSV